MSEDVVTELKKITKTLSQLKTEVDQLRQHFEGWPASMGIDDAARYLGISPKTIRNGLGPKAKHPFPIRPGRFGKRILFAKEDLDNFIRSMERV